MNVYELAEVYKKIEENRASKEEVDSFNAEILRRSYDRDFILEKLKQIIEHSQ